MQAFRKKIWTLLTLESLKWDTFVNAVFRKFGSLLSATCRHRSQCSYGIVTGDNKTRPKNCCRQFTRKIGPRANSVRFSSFRLWPFMTLGELATASERIG